MAATKKRGQQSVAFTNPPVIASWASMAGPMEGKGPFGAEFDWVIEDYLFGEKSWEKAESKMMRETIRLSARKLDLEDRDIQLILAGDLLNQIISSNFAARELSVPFLGLYGACSTLAEGLIIAGMLMDGGFYDRVAVGASSHHHTAERQFRFPVELGVQRPPSAQWTVTGAGAIILCDSGPGLRITDATVGKVIDMGQSDVNDMGGAMAPATADTLITHLQDLNRQPDYYDLIVTGDLGQLGSALFNELCSNFGYNLGERHLDCGVVVYDPKQDVHAGGSGCGCSAIMICGPCFSRMETGKIKRILLIGTGALMSPTTSMQGETIPSVAHAVVIEV
ncbi:MAG: stage V sporulation protein AD [Ignavibacteriales bacterium]